MLFAVLFATPEAFECMMTRGIGGGSTRQRYQIVIAEIGQKVAFLLNQNILQVFYRKEHFNFLEIQFRMDDELMTAIPEFFSKYCPENGFFLQLMAFLRNSCRLDMSNHCLDLGGSQCLFDKLEMSNQFVPF